MLHTCTTTMLPTAAAACAALGEGGSPCGAIFSHLPLLTSMMCTSLVAPASLIPAARAEDRASLCVSMRCRARAAPLHLPSMCEQAGGASPVPVGGPGEAGGPSDR